MWQSGEKTFPSFLGEHSGSCHYQSDDLGRNPAVVGNGGWNEVLLNTLMTFYLHAVSSEQAAEVLPVSLNWHHFWPLL